MKFNEISKILESTDKKYTDWVNTVEKIYQDDPSTRAWDVPELSIRFKKKNLKSTGLNVNGQTSNIKKTLLTFKDYKVTESVDMVKNDKSDWKKKNAKSFYVEFPKRFKERNTTFFSISDVKDKINTLETRAIRRAVKNINEAARSRQCKALEPIKDLNQYTKPFQKLLVKFDNKLATAQKRYYKLADGLTEGWWRSVGYALEELIEQLYTVGYIKSGDIEKFHKEQGWGWKERKGKITDLDAHSLAPSVSDLMC